MNARWVVGLPADARNLERQEWIADEVIEARGTAAVWAPEAAGLDVLLRGLSMIHDDERVLTITGPLFDALYGYRRRELIAGREPS